MDKVRTGILMVGTLSLVIAVAASVVVAPSNVQAADAAKPKIVETHIHVWQATRPGGIPWPPPANKQLFKDITPEDFKTVAKPLGFVSAGVVEASNIVDDQKKVLDQIKADKFYAFDVASLDIGSPDFTAQLDKLAKEPKFVGIRGFLWSPEITLDEKQLKDLKELAKRGLSLDLISRGGKNTKDKVDALATAVPNLKIIINHLGVATGAATKSKTPDPAWVKDMEKLAKHKNIYVKFSSYYDLYNPDPKGSEDNPWKAPTDVAAYKPYFDVVYKTFGADRLVYGSNWPVVTMGGTLENHVKLAEDYLGPMGKDVRDKVMFKNAQRFYKRGALK